MNEYIFIILLGTLFYFLDKMKYPCDTNLEVDFRKEIVHLLHNIGGIVTYIGPILTNNIVCLVLLLAGTAFLLIQGTVSTNKIQPCFLMPPYNKYCGLDENRHLFDIFSFIGINKNDETYPYVFYGINLALFAYMLVKLETAVP